MKNLVLSKPALHDTLLQFLMSNEPIPLLIKFARDIERQVIKEQALLCLNHSDMKSWTLLITSLNFLQESELSLSDYLILNGYSPDPNQRFLIIFYGLDTADDQALATQLYFAQKTVGMSKDKVIFVMAQDWVLPQLEQTSPIREIKFSLNELQIDRVPYEAQLTQFLNQYPDFITAISDTESQKMTNPILHLLIEVHQTLLDNIPKDQWPKNSHEMYGLWLKQHFGEEYYNTASKYIQQIALVLFKQNNIPNPQKDEPLLNNCPFLANSIVPIDRRSYVFTQLHWRDYFIAKAIWASFEIRNELDTTTPQQNLWNRYNLQNDFPGVLNFLVEFLNTSETKSHDVTLLKRKWQNNGVLVRWENAFANTNTLLDRIQLPVDVDQDTAKEFITIRPSREMRLLERLGKPYSEIKESVFGTLAFGGGIACVSPIYDNRKTKKISKDHRFIPINAQDFIVGEKLTFLAFSEISKGNLFVIQALIPDQCGFYSTDTLTDINQSREIIDSQTAELDFLELIEGMLWEDGAPLIRQALDKIDNFDKGTTSSTASQTNPLQKASFLTKHLSAYENKCRDETSGLDVLASEEKIAERVRIFKSQLKSMMKMRLVAIKKEISQDRITELPDKLDREKEQLNENIENSKSNISGLLKRKQIMLEGTEQRFALLMNLFKKTAAVYKEYTAADKEALKEEISAGNLTAVIARFNEHFLQEFYSSIELKIKQAVGNARKKHFLQWIENDANPEVQEKWNLATVVYQNFLLDSIAAGDRMGAIHIAGYIFKEETSPINALDESISNSVEQGIYNYMQSHDTLKQPLWRKMSKEEKVNLHSKIEEIFTQNSTLSAIVSNNPLLLADTCNEYLKRYLRLGLSVDACNSVRDTLLLGALKSLGSKKESNPVREISARGHAVAQNPIFEIIQYLINVGATVFVQNDEDNTPLEYVLKKINDYPQNWHWEEIKKALETVCDWFELQDGDEILLTLINDISNTAAGYDANHFRVSGYSFQAIFSFIGRLFRSDLVKNHRQEYIIEFPKKTAKLTSDVFHVKQDLLALVHETQQFPKRFKSRLGEQYLDNLEKCLERFNQGVPGTMVVADNIETTVDQVPQPSKDYFSLFGRRRSTTKTASDNTAGDNRSSGAMLTEEEIQEIRKKKKGKREDASVIPANARFSPMPTSSTPDIATRMPAASFANKSSTLYSSRTQTRSAPNENDRGEDEEKRYK